MSLFQDLKFKVSLEKVYLTPKEEIEFLGFLIKLKIITVKVTKEKCCKKLNTLNNSMLNRDNITITELPKLLGVLKTAFLGVRFGLLNPFYAIKSKKAALKLTKGSHDSYFSLTKQAVD